MQIKGNIPINLLAQWALLLFFREWKPEKEALQCQKQQEQRQAALLPRR